MFTGVLVANRGEIAVRIIRTLRRMGIHSVAVHSDTDSASPHVMMADEAVAIGPADARMSYLSIERLLAAAQSVGAQAIHPGYGFLSENAEFAQACDNAGIEFIGPRADSIRLMGDKRAAKHTVATLGVPVVPGFHAGNAEDSELLAQVQALGLPVIIKPAAGGGGKGMHVVTEPGEITAALASARREAMSAFGDDSLLFEKYIAAARHVEVQVVGDGRGGVVHLGDRDCSLQRRHQKVIEEAPAPFLPPAVRERIHADAVAIAECVSYRGAGTVEFVVDARDPTSVFFLEMNTRLQVEHPVTETVTGLDLVELQLRVAAGEDLTITQGDIRIVGHAIEARVYAEDGHHDFLPAAGTVLAYEIPGDVRVDSGITRGTVVGTAYDPLLFKVVAKGTDRVAALDALDVALSATTVLGVAHNIGVLRELVRSPAVRTGSMTTSLIGDMGLGRVAPPLDDHAIVAAALAAHMHSHRPHPAGVWDAAGAWRLGGSAAVRSSLVDESGRAHAVSVTGPLNECVVGIGDAPPRAASIMPWEGHRDGVRVTLDGVTRGYAVAVDKVDKSIWLGRGGDAWRLHHPRRDVRAAGSDNQDGGDLRTPMPGTVVVVAGSAGEPVHEGDVIAVIEAMKMEYAIAAPFDGVLSSVPVAVGVQVERDQIVAVITPGSTS